MLIDDFSDPAAAGNGHRWQCVTDRVMGGVSDARLAHETVAGRNALRLSGTVSLANNGGFVQAALDLADPGAAYDAGRFAGVALALRGDGGTYAVNLRTTGLRHPWQSYRCAVASTDPWRELQLPFSAFVAHRTDLPLDPRRLRRIGLIAIGQARRVDVAIADLRFFGD